MSYRVMIGIHALAGSLAWFMLLSFSVSTIFVELLGSASQVIILKTSIVYALPLLACLMAAMGITGKRLSAGRELEPLIKRKLKRIRLVGANAGLILIPSALVLWRLAVSGGFPGLTFLLVQTLELIAGAVNIYLVGSMLRDGLRLTGRIRASALS